MAKEKLAEIKLQTPASQANPPPPIDTALGSRGVNTMAFDPVMSNEYASPARTETSLAFSNSERFFDSAGALLRMTK